MFQTLMLLLITVNGNWPGFLGMGASPIDPKSVPLSWSPSENIAWKQPLPGYGQSSPVIWDGKVFLTAVEGANKEKLLVLCVDLKSGEVLWKYSANSSFPEKNSVYISRAAPTPLVDSDRVYAYFESGDVVALTHDGEEAWTLSLTEKFAKPTNRFGLSASPVQLADRIAILIDDPETAYLASVDKATGEVMWKTDRSARTSWSSPAVIEFEGEPQIVCSSAGSVDGYDPTSGNLLWSYTDVGGNTGTTPLALGEGKFLIAASPGRDGATAVMAKKSNGVMQVEKQAGEWEPRVVWSNPSATPSWASPVGYQGYAYWVNRAGVLYCLDQTTGEVAYTKRIKQGAWATPIGVGDHLLIFGRDGVTSVIAVGPKFKVVAENELWTKEAPPINNTPATEEDTEQRRRLATMFTRPTVYGVAVVDGQIVIRTGSELFCVREDE